MNLPSLSANKSFTGLDFGKAQTVFAPVGAVIVSLAVLAFVVWPKFNQALLIRTENEQLVSRISLLSDKVKILESLDKTVLDRQVISSERLLPSDKATFAFVRQIETIASTSGTVLNKVEVAPGLITEGGSSTSATSPGPTPNQTAVGAVGNEIQEAAPSIQVKITVTSDYKSLVNFLERLFALARVNSADDLTIASTVASGELAPLRSSMVINAYWRQLPLELGSIESPVEQLTDAEEEILVRVGRVTVSEPAAQPSAVPVPTGRTDLFAPF